MAPPPGSYPQGRWGINPELFIGSPQLHNPVQVKVALKTVVGSKQPGYVDHLAGLVSEACVNVCPKNQKGFNVDNIRVCKLDGCSVSDSSLIHGFVIARGTEGTVTELKDAKIAVYNCAVDNASTDTKGKVDITDAEQLKNFSKTEEQAMEDIISGIAKSGVKVIVSSQSFGDMAMHFIERFGMMAVKVASKFEIRRLTAAVNATQIVTLDPPSAEVWCGGAAWRGIAWCGAVRCGAVQWCGVVWLPKALLPEGKGRDVYPWVQVNTRAVCVPCALCASVFSAAESWNRETWRLPTRPLLLAQELPRDALRLRLLVQA